MFMSHMIVYNNQLIINYNLFRTLAYNDADAKDLSTVQIEPEVALV